jgi:HD-GYP domain-containing protein (c-di-GMP phosphodiesterase class II)/CHASE1-domain containing sensor protein
MQPDPNLPEKSHARSSSRPFSLSPGRWRRSAPMALATVLGLVLTIGLFVCMRRWERHDNQAEFDSVSSHYVEAIRRVMEGIELTHEIVQQDYYGSPHVSREEFSLCANPIFARVPSLKVLQWAPRVARRDRDTFERDAQEQGWPKYRIVEPNLQGQLVPAAVRDEYFPIWYAASKTGFEARFGWDFAADPALRWTIATCRDSGKFVVSGAVDLSKVGIPGACVQTFLPVYQKPPEASAPANRRSQLQGLLVGLCQVDDLVERAVSYAAGPQGIDLAIFDETSPANGRLLYHRPSRTRPQDGAAAKPPDMQPAGIHCTAALEFGGRNWSLVCTPAPYFFTARASWRSWTVLAIGLAVTCLSGGYVRGAVTRTERIERIVAERTAELRLKDEQLLLAQKLEARAVRAAHEETIHRLVRASLCRDEETGTHIRRTGLLAEVLARAAGWSGAEAEVVRLAAPMHDVGKIGIPDAVLRKRGKLTPAEYDIMKTHTTIGARMLAGSRSAILAMACDIALNHHERWDGTGYPRGLAGANIPEAARILSIADVYDALSHDRVYRPAMPEDEVLSLLQGGSGTQFDPMLLALFFARFDDMRRIAQENPDDLAEGETAMPSCLTDDAGMVGSLMVAT